MNLRLPPEGRKVDRQATRVLHIPSPGDAKLLRSHDDGRQRLLVDESPVTASLVNYCEVVPDVAAFPRAVLAPAPGGYMLCVMKAIHVQHQSTLALCRDSSYPFAACRASAAGESQRPGVHCPTDSRRQRLYVGLLQETRRVRISENRLQRYYVCHAVDRPLVCCEILRYCTHAMMSDL